MSKLVTIGVPIYKRLEYLPNVLKIVAAQDYPNIELLVSDNGMNGDAVPAIVDKHYPKPYKFRQNPSTVSGSRHYNQLIFNASGEYVTILADDDEISSNFVSELLALLERHPEASAALAREETIDESGNVIRSSAETVSEILSGPDFIRATWGTRKYGFQALCTFLAKTDQLKTCGGFPDIWAATSDEDLLMVKLCVDNFVALSTRCAFRKRYYESSGGYAISMQDLARGIREYLSCLAAEPKISQYARSHPIEWRELYNCLIDSAWKTYYYRWLYMYRKRLGSIQWVKAAFAMPFLPRYYRAVASTFKSEILTQVKRTCPQAYSLYRAAKTRLSKTA